MLCASLLLGLVPAVATAATASTISINPSIAANSTVAYNTAVTITGTIDPVHQATVAVQSKRSGNDEFKTLASTTADANGNYSYTFKATASGSYQVKWDGDADHASATSSSVTINVQSNIVLGKTPKPNWAGQEFFVNGRLEPRHRGVQVSVQINNKGTWKTISKGKTDKNSNYSVKTSISKTGKHRLRVAFGDTDHALASSDGFDINLKWANPWKISASYDHYIVVNKRTFKLWYLRNGRIVRTFRAGVGQRSYPTPSGNFQITRKGVRPTWYNPNTSWSKDMPESIAWPATPFGERALYLNVADIRIHGTIQPWLLDRPYRAVSHGCIRLKNEWIIWLYNRVPTSTPVKIYG